jgi:hypothetical protein
MKLKLIGIGAAILVLLGIVYVMSIDTDTSIPVAERLRDVQKTGVPSNSSTEPMIERRTPKATNQEPIVVPVPRQGTSRMPETASNPSLEPEQGEEVTRKGTVYDYISGQPIPGLALQLDGTSEPIITDEQGRFTLPPLPTGTYVIAIIHDFTSLPDGLETVGFVIDPKIEPEDIEIDVIFGGMIEGSVWMDGEPLSGANVVLQALSSPDSPSGMKDQATITDADGAFFFKGVNPGEAGVIAAIRHSTGGYNRKVMRAIVEPGAVTHVDFDFIKSLEGQLIFGDMAVQAAYVSVLPVGDQADPEQQFRAEAGDDGTYWIDGLPAGIHRAVAQVSVEGMGTIQKFAWVEIHEGQVAYQTFDFTEGATIVGLIVDLLQGENIAILVLNGTDAEHDYAATDFDTLANQYRDRLYGVDNSGRFTVRNLELGDYTVFVRETKYNEELGREEVMLYRPAVITLSNIGDAIMEIKRVR